MSFAGRIFDVDRWAGTTTYAYSDNEGGLILETVSDVEPLLEQNKALHADTDERAPFEEFTRVASIPLVVWEQWKKEGDVRDKAFLRKKLNDPDNRFFRTRPGRI